MDSNLNSILLEKAVTELSRLPGLGKKTALRLALHLLRQDEEMAVNLGEAIINMRKGISYCKECHNICETDYCEVCSNPSRDHSTICVVESIKDVISIENTNQFRGVYHVLGGLISPIDGIGPDMLEIDSLIERVHSNNVKEVIIALSATIEGETTGFYIYKRLSDAGCEISQLARGLSVGNDLEYTDEVTLGRSLLGRRPFSDSFHDEL